MAEVETTDSPPANPLILNFGRNAYFHAISPSIRSNFIYLYRNVYLRISINLKGNESECYDIGVTNEISRLGTA